MRWPNEAVMRRLEGDKEENAGGGCSAIESVHDYIMSERERPTSQPRSPVLGSEMLGSSSFSARMRSGAGSQSVSLTTTM